MTRFFAAVHESAFGTKRTSSSAQLMSPFGGKADIAKSFVRSLQLDIGRLDHLAPLFGLIDH
jgi:hypothetical protein